MTYVAFPKFDYVGMLESIMRYHVTHLMYLLFSSTLVGFERLMYRQACSPAHDSPMQGIRGRRHFGSPVLTRFDQHPATETYELHRHIRFVFSGAAPLSMGILEQLSQMFPKAHIGQAYGNTYLSYPMMLHS
jgi:4-coumarate--CoA ligase